MEEAKQLCASLKSENEELKQKINNLSSRLILLLNNHECYIHNNHNI